MRSPTGDRGSLSTAPASVWTATSEDGVTWQLGESLPVQGAEPGAVKARDRGVGAGDCDRGRRSRAEHFDSLEAADGLAGGVALLVGDVAIAHGKDKIGHVGEDGVVRDDGGEGAELEVHALDGLEDGDARFHIGAPRVRSISRGGL